MQFVSKIALIRIITTNININRYTNKHLELDEQILEKTAKNFETLSTRPKRDLWQKNTRTISIRREPWKT